MHVESCRGVFQSTRHLCELQNFMMRQKCRFVKFFVVHFNLTIAKIDIKGWKQLSFAQRINAFIYAKNGVAFFFCDSIETPVVDKKSRATVLPGHKSYRIRPLCYRGLSPACLAHLLYFSPSSSRCFRPAWYCAERISGASVGFSTIQCFATLTRPSGCPA